MSDEATYYDEDGVGCSAEVVDRLTEVALPGGVFTAKEGDVVVTYPSGVGRVVSGSSFAANFTDEAPKKEAPKAPPAKKPAAKQKK